MLPQSEWVTEKYHHWISNTCGAIAPTNQSVWIQPSQSVARILADSIGDVAQVQSICFSVGKDGYSVWVLLERDNWDDSERVYQKELDICTKLNLYDFDFRVSSVDLVDPEELKKTGLVEIFRRP